MFCVGRYRHERGCPDAPALRLTPELSEARAAPLYSSGAELIPSTRVEEKIRLRYAGDVLRGFLRRTLSRDIAQSTVAVVGGASARAVVEATARGEGHDVRFVNASSRVEAAADAGFGCIFRQPRVSCNHVLTTLRGKGMANICKYV